MTSEETKRQIKSVQKISERFKPLLAGYGPDVQGAVLANLTSLWLAGHHPELREDVFANHIKMILELVQPSEHEIFGDGGFPVGGVN